MHERHLDDQTHAHWAKTVESGCLVYSLEPTVSGHQFRYIVRISLMEAYYSSKPERYCANALRRARHDMRKSIGLQIARMERRHVPVLDDDLSIKDY